MVLDAGGHRVPLASGDESSPGHHVICLHNGVSAIAQPSGFSFVQCRGILEVVVV